MTFLELCKERFSVRKYADTPVSDEDIAYIMECVRMAQSAVNFQPWKFLIIRSEEARKKVQQCYDREWFTSAPLYIIGMRNVKENWVRACDGKQHGDIDVAIATEHLCLAAAECGLGTCWVGNYNSAKVEEYFHEDGYEPVVIIPMGHIADDCVRPEKKRKPLEEIVKEL